MKLKHCSMTLLFFISLTLFPYLILSQTCQRTYGKQPIKYPFGTGPGCGDPRFQTHITCSQDQLTFSTHTGCYPVTSIDYTNQVLYITDPSMSTCSCSQPSKGFGLDWDAPFSFHDDNTFALLDCSTTSSPIYKPIPETTALPQLSAGSIPLSPHAVFTLQWTLGHHSKWICRNCSALRTPAYTILEGKTMIPRVGNMGWRLNTSSITTTNFRRIVRIAKGVMELVGILELTIHLCATVLVG
ncbi:hypothetical protein CsSME_00043732 [Camellia sinensis var. sinensis]